MLVACASPTSTTEPSQPPSTVQRDRTDPISNVEPTATTTPTTPTPRPTSTSTPAPALIAFVPVVGFWSTKVGISRGELEAALAGRSRLYQRVLADGAVPGSAQSTAEQIRAAVNDDPRTLGLLPADEVSVDVLVELTFLVGYINLLNLFNNSLGVRYRSDYRALLDPVAGG
jgi:hypothetical protein